MDNKALKPWFILGFYILLTILNGLYTLQVRSTIEFINSPWFVIFPILFYFYFVFAIIAALGLYYRKDLGLILAYCVLMFGNIMAVVSYSFVYNNHYALEHLIIPLIVINLCVIFYMAFNHNYYRDD